LLSGHPRTAALWDARTGFPKPSLLGAYGQSSVLMARRSSIAL